MSTPSQDGPTTRTRSTGTPRTPAAAVRPAAQRASKRKTAGSKAAKPVRVGTGVPSANQPPARRKGKKKPVKRRPLPRTAAVGIMAVSVQDAGALPYSEIMRKAREDVPDVKARFGIREVRPRCSATGGPIIRDPRIDAPRQTHLRIICERCSQRGWG